MSRGIPVPSVSILFHLCESVAKSFLQWTHPWQISHSSIQNHIGSLFADHETGGDGIAADHRGHDRGVGHAQSLDAVDPQLRIDHSHGVLADLAGAGRVPERGRLRADEALGIARAGGQLLAAQFRIGVGGRNGSNQFQRLEEDLVVGLLAQVVRVDARRGQRIGRVQSHFADG